jgi:transposase
MPYRIAGIDVHKKMLAVAVADVEVEGDVHFERLKVGTSPVQLRALAEWLVEREVEEVVMESTAQYWRPVWEALERYWRPKRRTRADANPVSSTLHLAHAQSNRGAGGRKRDFPDAERLVKRLVAQELTLSFVPDAEQRLWRTVMRRKYQVTRSRVQLHNRLESLLEEPTSRSRVSCPICWAPARGACCMRSATVKRIRRRWLAWPISDCGQRPSNCATPLVRARIVIRYIDGW